MLFTKEKLAKFLAGEGKDFRGRLLEDILKKDDRWWDRTHDFIQWVFPNSERSRYNSLAPVCSASDELKYPYIEESFDRFYTFLRNTDWKHKGNHNLLRITRVIKCMRIFNREDLAEQLLQYVLNETEKIRGLEKSKNYWMRS